jgi:hypothetical protein
MKEERLCGKIGRFDAFVTPFTEGRLYDMITSNLRMIMTMGIQSFQPDLAARCAHLLVHAHSFSFDTYQFSIGSNAWRACVYYRLARRLRDLLDDSVVHDRRLLRYLNSLKGLKFRLDYIEVTFE